MPDGCWSNDLTSGARQVDAANESLFFLISHLFKPGVECKRRGGYCPHDGCGKVSAVLRFVTRNIAAENRLMAEAGYPDAAAHHRAHDELLAAVRDLFERCLCGDEDDDMIRAVITAWAKDHVQRHDKPLGAWLATGQNMPPVTQPTALSSTAPM